jgi:hypothetical protein
MRRSLCMRARERLTMTVEAAGSSASLRLSSLASCITIHFDNPLTIHPLSITLSSSSQLRPLAMGCASSVQFDSYTTLHHLHGELNIEGLATFMLNKKRCKKIIVMAGAGISVSAGIPDFRSIQTGIYEQIKRYPASRSLTSPQDLFDINFFRQNPDPFYAFASKVRLASSVFLT